MPFRCCEHDRIHVLQIRGKVLGCLERESLRRIFDRLIASGEPYLVLDLSGAEFMDSAALGLFIEGAGELRAAGGEVRLACLQHRIRNLFVVTRMLGPVFESYPSVEAAVQRFAASSQVPFDGASQAPQQANERPSSSTSHIIV